MDFLLLFFESVNKEQFLKGPSHFLILVIVEVSFKKVSYNRVYFMYMYPSSHNATIHSSLYIIYKYTWPSRLKPDSFKEHSMVAGDPSQTCSLLALL